MTKKIKLNLNMIMFIILNKYKGQKELTDEYYFIRYYTSIFESNNTIESRSTDLNMLSWKRMCVSNSLSIKIIFYIFLILTLISLLILFVDVRTSLLMVPGILVSFILLVFVVSIYRSDDNFLKAMREKLRDFDEERGEIYQ